MPIEGQHHVALVEESLRTVHAGEQGGVKVSDVAHDP